MKTISLRNRNGSMLPFMMILGAMVGLYYYQSRGGNIVDFVKRIFGFMNQRPARRDSFASTASTSAADLDRTPAI